MSYIGHEYISCLWRMSIAHKQDMYIKSENEKNSQKVKKKGDS